MKLKVNRFLFLFFTQNNVANDKDLDYARLLLSLFTLIQEPVNSTPDAKTCFMFKNYMEELKKIHLEGKVPEHNKPILIEANKFLSDLKKVRPNHTAVYSEG